MKIQQRKLKSGFWEAILNVNRQLVRTLETESPGSHMWGTRSQPRGFVLGLSPCVVPYDIPLLTRYLAGSVFENKDGNDLT